VEKGKTDINKNLSNDSKDKTGDEKELSDKSIENTQNTKLEDKLSNKSIENSDIFTENTKLENEFFDKSIDSIVTNLIDNTVDKVIEDLPISQEEKAKIISYDFSEFKLPINITIDLVNKFLVKNEFNKPPQGMYL
tara:strand:- start:4787 stop:5194 length:408 start_codon:yes stop_codon:yes gene_type:complete